MSTSIFVGIDWAKQAHDVCVEDERGHVMDEFHVPHTARDLAQLCDRLDKLCDGDRQRVHVAIEVPHGIVVDTLFERGYRVFSINPKQLDRFRDRFSPTGAKDDRRDARVLADSLRTDARAFRLVSPDDPKVIELREWSRIHEELGQERVKLTNRMHHQLRRYYPAFEEVTADLGATWAIVLWRLVPSPQAAKRVKRSRIQDLLKKHRIRKHDADGVLGILRQGPMISAPGVSEAAQVHLSLLCDRLAVVNKQIRACHKRLEAMLDELTPNGDEPGERCEQRDVEIARSMPGVGAIVLATLLAEASQPLRRRDYHVLRALSGAAPVTKASGNRKTVMIRRACNWRLRNALYHWARVAVQRDHAAKTQYAALRGHGKSHGTALRSVGDRLLRVLCAMLRDQTFHRATAPATA